MSNKSKGRPPVPVDLAPELEDGDVPQPSQIRTRTPAGTPHTPQSGGKLKQAPAPLGAPMFIGDMENTEQDERFVEQRIEPGDLQAVALMYDDLMKAVPNRSPQENERMISAFDNHLQLVMQTLDQRLSEIASPYARSIEVLQAKNGIMDIVVQELCGHLDSAAPNVSSLVRGLFAVQADLLSSAQPIVQACLNACEKDLEKAKLIAKTASRLPPPKQVGAKDQQVHKSQSRSAAQPSRFAAPTTASQSSHGKVAPAPSVRRWEPDKTWSNLVKSTFSDLKKDQPSQESQEEVISPDGSKTIVVKREKGVVEKVVEKEGFRVLFNTESPPPKHRYRIREQETKKQQVLLDSRPMPGRNLTQRQVVDLIEDIYASKIKYDQQCRANNLPLETMGQHVYTFLSQRYGLSKLVNDWTEALQIGVKKYADESVDVRVFAHIINNDIDEDFRFVHSQVKVTTGDLLKVYLRGKYPTKSEKELSDMVHSRVTGQVPEDEWLYTIRNLYNPEDAGLLCEQVYDSIEQRLTSDKRDKAHPLSSSTSKKDICTADFKVLMELILSFQLKGHLSFLGKFRHLFRLFDTDEDGVLSQDQTADLLLAVSADLSPEVVQNILEAADPGATHQFTFSQCVGIVSSQLVRNVQVQPSHEEQQYEQGYDEDEPAYGQY